MELKVLKEKTSTSFSLCLLRLARLGLYLFTVKTWVRIP